MLPIAPLVFQMKCVNAGAAGRRPVAQDSLGMAESNWGCARYFSEGSTPVLTSEYK